MLGLLLLLFEFCNVYREGKTTVERKKKKYDLKEMLN